MAMRIGTMSGTSLQAHKPARMHRIHLSAVSLWIRQALRVCRGKVEPSGEQHQSAKAYWSCDGHGLCPCEPLAWIRADTLMQSTFPHHQAQIAILRCVAQYHWEAGTAQVRIPLREDVRIGISQ